MNGPKCVVVLGEKMHVWHVQCYWKVIIKNAERVRYWRILMTGELYNYFHIKDENKNPNLHNLYREYVWLPKAYPY